MTERVHLNPHLIYSVGTQIVSLRDVVGAGGRVLHPRGSVGVVVRSPGDLEIENDATQEHYWELQRFLILALKANPNVLECLYTPLIERSTPLADELLQMRSIFLSRLVYQTYNGYVVSQFKKMQSDLKNQGQVKWKHVMHLIRLLISGINVLKHGLVTVHVGDHREQLLAIKRGEVPWDETERWRLSLHAEFDQALTTTNLPDRPDYERANAFLIKARRQAATTGSGQ